MMRNREKKARGDDGKAWRRAAGRGRNWNDVLTSRHVPGGRRFEILGVGILCGSVRSSPVHREARFSGTQAGAEFPRGARTGVSVCGGASVAC